MEPRNQFNYRAAQVSTEELYASKKAASEALYSHAALDILSQVIRTYSVPPPGDTLPVGNIDFNGFRLELEMKAIENGVTAKDAILIIVDRQTRLSLHSVTGIPREVNEITIQITEQQKTHLKEFLRKTFDIEWMRKER
jgi:hypothetical protein